MSLRLELLFFAVAVAVLSLLMTQASSAAVHKRDSEKGPTTEGETEADTEEDVEECQGQGPCGWAVYDKKTREIQYFMKNKCKCRENQKCGRDKDDIQLTAYVYRCKDK